VTGGPGPDWIDSGAGEDTIRVRDGRRDRVRCGEGTDTVRADPIDVLVGCEVVRMR
jgi:hypothetical protein